MNGLAFDSRDYLKLNLLHGPSFADWLKKARQAMTIKSLSKRLIEDNKAFIREIEDNTYGLVLDKERYDYDSFFHEQHLISFMSDADDLEWAFEEVHENEVWLEAFELAAKKYLLDHKIKKVKDPDNDDKATWISDSITPTEDGPMLNRRLMRQLASEGVSDDFIESSREQEYMEFKRSSVFVAPGNSRDTWQCYPKTLFKVKRISHKLRQILDVLPHSAMASPEKADHRRKRIKRDDALYFLFDYKKCGLTVNRRLLMILSRVLNDIYPESGFDEISHFADIRLHNGETVVYPTRGVGLGNCNEGVTLIQCVLGHMLYQAKGIDSVFFNDDGVFIEKENEIRSPFRWILSAISHLGMIINLKKTIVSDCNVFCEDYFITKENLDYSKTQSLILPFAEVFFRSNISEAKVLYADLQRGIVGRNVQVELENSLVDWWGTEFHPSEVWWPFEFGGWRSYLRGSINRVMEVLFDPQEFCPVNYRGSIPYFKEWAYYLISSQKIREMVRTRSNIVYAKFIENPFKDVLYNYPHSEFTELVCSTFGLQTNPERKATFDRLYNERGMKNAKPIIKMGKAIKLNRYRKSIWKGFRRTNKGIRRVFEQHEAYIQAVRNYLRGNEITPQMYSPPLFLFEQWIDIPDYEQRKLGNVIFGKTTRNVPLSKAYRALESINEGIIKADAYMNSLRSLEFFVEPSGIVCEGTFHDYRGVKPSMPLWIKTFFGRKKIARIYYVTYYNRLPIRWRDLAETEEINRIFKYPIDMIFDGLQKPYDILVRKLNKRSDGDEIMEAFHNYDYKDSRKFQSAIDVTLAFLDANEDQPSSEKIDEDLWGVDVFELDIDDDLIDFQLGETTFDDILDEYIDDYASDPFDEYEDDDDLFFTEEAGRTTLTDVKPLLGEDL
jgi:hypothetical protein